MAKHGEELWAVITWFLTLSSSTMTKHGEELGPQDVPAAAEEAERKLQVAVSMESPDRSAMTEEQLNDIFHPIMAQRCWRATTLGLDYTELAGPIERLESQGISWELYMVPMVQAVAGTCVLVACTVCVEALHRLQHDKLYGKGTTFPYRAAPLDELLEECRKDGVWKRGVGADVGQVLTKIQQMGGVLATAIGTNGATTPAPYCFFLPVRSWQQHRWDDDAGEGLSPESVARLLRKDGPCIGLLWVAPWYDEYVGDGDDAPAYSSGCGRSDDDARRREIEERCPRQTGWHAVVCFGYRFRGDQMHVLVMDNHDATGPRRWIHVKELHTLYTLTVCLEPGSRGDQISR